MHVSLFNYIYRSLASYLCFDLLHHIAAEHYGLPYVQPYFGDEKVNLEAGVNFAVAGVPALDVEFYEERGIDFRNNISMKTQLKWFRDLLPSICKNSSNNVTAHFKIRHFFFEL